MLHYTIEMTLRSAPSKISVQCGFVGLRLLTTSYPSQITNMYYLSRMNIVDLKIPKISFTARGKSKVVLSVNSGLATQLNTH